MRFFPSVLKGLSSLKRVAIYYDKIGTLSSMEALWQNDPKGREIRGNQRERGQNIPPKRLCLGVR